MNKFLKYISFSLFILIFLSISSLSAISSEDIDNKDSLQLFKRNLTLTKANYERAEALYVDGIISKKEYQTLKEKYLTAQQNYTLALNNKSPSFASRVKEYNMIRSDKKSLKEHIKQLKDDYNKLVDLYYKGLVSEDELINVEIEYKSSLIRLDLIQLQANYKLGAPSLKNPLSVLYGKQGFKITSLYGYRTHPITGQYAMHNGIDIAAPAGTPVYAYSDGIVMNSTNGAFSGNYVQIAHGKGYSSLYLHLSSYVVNPKQYVKKGQLIGYVGSTGRSTGNHLHFELRLNGSPININNLVNSKLVSK